MSGSELERVGIDTEEQLVGRWSIIEKSLHLHVRQRNDIEESSMQGWLKLTRPPSGRGRLISITVRILWDLGLDPAEELIGRWGSDKNGLLLKIMYRSTRRVAVSEGNEPDIRKGVLPDAHENVEKKYWVYRTSDLNQQELLLYETLRLWRSQVALARNVPEYLIPNNDTMATIARYKPSNTKDLLRIHGIREKKAEEFGGDIIRILSEFKSSTKNQGKALQTR
jgi:superfamily II DNA helicase RecQ